MATTTWKILRGAHTKLKVSYMMCVQEVSNMT